MTATTNDNVADGFIQRWKQAGGSERGNYQLFLNELCDLLGVELPQPHSENELDNAYVYERRIVFRHGDGSESSGFIDLYRRGAFVCEAKKLKQSSHTKGFDDALLRARSQAENYARALPANEGRPPFLIVVDVGTRIELYSEFSRSGATYTPFPDPRSHRITLDDLAREDIRQRLAKVWTDPLSLDPSRESARVTRDIAARLAELAKSLEAAGHAPEAVAQFLMRCLFTMFAEDVRLLPADSFRDLLHKHREQPDTAMRMLAQLWRDMDGGGFSAVLADDVLRFNGKLFKQPDTLPLGREQIDLLIRAANADWKHVEPAIFGTLLERALSTKDRHKLGAHYTPRAYVERLVLPTVIEPLREEWQAARAAALMHLRQAEIEYELAQTDTGRKSQKVRLKPYNAELNEARNVLLEFHRRLCAVRVLDPACGSGNFLYVTLEHLKRLEGEVLNAFDEFGLSRLGVTEQTGIDVEGARAIATEAQTVDPHNLLGIEINPRAAAIAEVVLWIGYLQWHFRTRGDVNPPVPVIRDFRNIECRDAVLAYDAVEYVTDEHGKVVTRWDGETMKASPVTGEKIPDESAVLPLERYLNPRKATWPAADFVVGNPPYLGARRIRRALGNGYLVGLRSAWPEVPEHVDFVMYWWSHAAKLVGSGAVKRSGLITSNSIRQTFSRKVLDAAFAEYPKLNLAFVVPDHPWTDASDGAAVRVALTVVDAQLNKGRLESVVTETASSEDEVAAELSLQTGKITSNLSIGIDPNTARALRSNAGLACVGYQLTGKGFVVDSKEATSLTPASDIAPIKPLLTGRDLTQSPRDLFAIDLYGLSTESVRRDFPAIYQWILERVKPERDQNNRESLRERWWIYGEPRSTFRPALKQIKKVIATSLTAKHRAFVSVDANTVCDSTTVMFAFEDAFQLGVLSSAIHMTWALGAGGRLGVGNDPRYNKTRCFDPFPFPVANEQQTAHIRELGEQLDAHRKRQQAAHPGLTLTGMYNVLEKLRSGEELSAKERTIHEQGLVSVLRQIHDELDAAVLDAYGWSDLLPLLRVAHGNEQSAQPHPNPPLPAREGGQSEAKRAFDEAILERLVALNAERAAEEARGLVRWLRPAFQNPQGSSAGQDALIDDAADATTEAPAADIKRQPWPKDSISQVKAVADLLATSPAALSLEQIAERFSARGPWKKRLPPLLEMLVALGRAQERDGRYLAH